MLILGDCTAELAKLDADSIDACVTDPPYGLEFMGKDWDKLGDMSCGQGKCSKPGIGDRDTAWPSSRGWNDKRCQSCGHLSHGGSPCHCEHPIFVPCDDRWQRMQAWHEDWVRAVYRVLKPGAHLLAFGGSRTHHRLMCAIEDAGFEIRDVLMWLYGTGFPKSLNLGDGRGTALKPAYEPIILARKPLVGTVAKNVLKHGTGALNIDACRIGYRSEDDKAGATPQGAVTSKKLAGDGGLGAGSGRDGPRGLFDRPKQLGRWPANVILDEEAGAMLDAQSGVSKSTGGMTTRFAPADPRVYSTPGAPKLRQNTGGLGDVGGASRFFYCAKASKAERGEGCDHPTVKPLALMKYLIQLVTPPGGVVLDPFMGSGTTGIACRELGFDFLGIEKDLHYMEIAKNRLGRSKQPRRPTA